MMSVWYLLQKQTGNSQFEDIGDVASIRIGQEDDLSELVDKILNSNFSILGKVSPVQVSLYQSGLKLNLMDLVSELLPQSEADANPVMVRISSLASKSEYHIIFMKL